MSDAEKEMLFKIECCLEDGSIDYGAHDEEEIKLLKKIVSEYKKDNMFEKRNISKEEVIKRACKDNDLEYCHKNKLIINPSLNDIKYSIGDKFILSDINFTICNQDGIHEISYKNPEAEIVSINIGNDEPNYIIYFSGHTIYVNEEYLNSSIKKY